MGHQSLVMTVGIAGNYRLVNVHERQVKLVGTIINRILTHKNTYMLMAKNCTDFVKSYL